MKIVRNTPEALEVIIEIPRLFVWFMLLPLVLLGGLLGLFQLLGSEFANALVTAAIFALLVLAGRYFLTQRTRVLLDASDGRVHLLRSTMLEEKHNDYPLAQLEAAETRASGQRDESEGSGVSHTLELVFSNTRPATRVPLSAWAIAGSGAGLLANAINDWLRAHRG